MRRLARLLAVFGLILALGLVMARPSADNGWFGDDLWHVRSYSGDELASAWTGTWDPTGVGTPGYRPLLTLSLHLRSELLGAESPRRNRYVDVVVTALALAVLAFALWRLGVPLYIGVAAAGLALTARNFSFTFTWISLGYHALQMLSFGLALLAVAATLTGARYRRTLLGASALLWAVTLLLKDQGLLLLPVLAAVALAGLAPRRYAQRYPDGALEYGRLWSVLRAETKAQWRCLDVRAYLVAIVLLAVANVAARFAFVRDSPAPGGPVDILTTFLRQLGWAVDPAGLGVLRSTMFEWATPIYLGLAAIVLVFVLLAPTFMPRRPARDLATPWILGLFAILGLVATNAFAPIRTAPMVGNFPLYFYALLVCATVVLVVRMLAPHRRALRAAAVGIAAFAVASLVSSIQASVDVQRGMGPSSIETFKYEYDVTYGRFSDRARMTAARRNGLRAHLREVGITGPRKAESDDTLPYLHCRSKHDPRIRIPRERGRLLLEDEPEAPFENLDYVCPYIDGAIR